MKNGIPEKKNCQTLMSVYKKLTIDGMTKVPLTSEEMVLIFCMSKYVENHFNDYIDERG